MKLRSRLSLYTLIISGASFFVSIIILVTFDYSVSDSPKLNYRSKGNNVNRKKQPQAQPLVQHYKSSFTLLPTVNLTLLSRKIADNLNDAQFMDKLISSYPIADLYLNSDSSSSLGINHPEKPQSTWNIAANWINAREIIPENATDLNRITQLMATSKILKSSIPPKGTQLKVMLVLEGNQQVLFKPMRYSRDHIINGEPYAGPDRHNGEIVAFHLSRILNLRVAPITVGRRLQVAKELKLTASENLLATFLKKPDLANCFYGRCLYCNLRDYVCPNQDDGHLEGALVLMFPPRFRLERVRSPWQRTYKSKVKAKWEVDHLYCYNRVIPVLTLQRILDLVDTAIFDYLIGNADRHHYEIFRGTPESAILLIDNGKSFGNPFKDELSILAPLYQCCLLRESTYKRLLIVEKNGLSNLVEQLTRKDPLYPLLTGEHLFALDRRLKQILALVDICIDEKGESKVFQRDT